MVVRMYNLLEYNGNYFTTSRSLWNSYTDEVNDDENENNNSGNYRIINSKTTTSKSFEYKTDNSRLDAEVNVRFKIFEYFFEIIQFTLG